MAEIQIQTTQNVNINFKSAEIEKRVLAFLIDILIKYSYAGLVGYIIYSLSKGNKTGVLDTLDSLDQWSIMAIVIILVLPIVFYSLVFETFFLGQTIGKKLFNIKVVKIDGFRANFIDYFIRWVMRIIDISFLPILPGIIAFLTAFNSKKAQRLGGIASGTAVIDLQKKVLISNTILKELEISYIPKYPNVIKLTDNDMRIIKETFENAVKKQNYKTLQKLKNKIIEVTKIEPSNKESDLNFIDTVIKDFNFYTGKA